MVGQCKSSQGFLVLELPRGLEPLHSYTPPQLQFKATTALPRNSIMLIAHTGHP
jgi:hypothetical protein